MIFFTSLYYSNHQSDNNWNKYAFKRVYKKIWEQASKSGLDKKLKTGIKISSLAKKFGLDISKKLFAKVHDSFGGNVRLLISGAAGIDPDVSKGFRDLGLTVL